MAHNSTVVSDMLTIDETIARGNAIGGKLPDVKIPPFDADYPIDWLNVAEDLLCANNITDSLTKYSIITYNLPISVGRNLRIPISSIDPFGELKEKFKKTFALSAKEKMRTLVQNAESRSKKPSKILEELKRIIPHHLLQEMEFKELYMAKLPINIQRILVTVIKSQTIEEMAEVGDRIYEDSFEINAVMKSRDSEFDEIKNQMRSIQNQIQEIMKFMMEFREERSRKLNYRPLQNRSPSRNRERNYNPNGPFCYQHFTRGKYAEKCDGGCTYNQQRPPQQKLLKQGSVNQQNNNGSSINNNSGINQPSNQNYNPSESINAINSQFDLLNTSNLFSKIYEYLKF